MRHRATVKDALISQIVNSEDGRQPRLQPFQIARDEGTLPIIGMNQVSRPIFVDASKSDACRAVGECRKANIVVAPVDAALIPIRRTDTFKQSGANDDIVGEAVGSTADADLEGGEGG